MPPCLCASVLKSKSVVLVAINKEKGQKVFMRHSSRGVRAQTVWSASGFTLIELLIVIAIIGVLSSVLLTSFSGGTEAARAAKCLSNMRNLAQGAISVASRTTWFPYAGSHAVIGADSTGQTVYSERVGWISWLSKNDEYGTRTKGKAKPTSFQSCESLGAYCSQSGQDEDGDFALSNGKLWTAVGKERAVYTCPAHVLRAGKKKIRVRWSYVMNAYFGYDSTKGSDAVGTADGTEGVYFSSSRLDRRLLFAELPISGQPVPSTEMREKQSDDYPTGDGNPLTDCVLQYKANVNGKGYNTDWDGAAEAIAFNHKSGKRWCAHVVFADGHTEKLLAPRSSGGLSDEQLTALLCAGVDVGFDGSSYSLIDKGDEN